MRFANIRTLKTHTAELLQAVEAGEEVIITYHGQPKAVLLKIAAEAPRSKAAPRQPGILRKGHPFLQLIGTGTDDATDVSTNKYHYIGLAAEGEQ
jgi:prevent-host-death family protein